MSSRSETDDIFDMEESSEDFLKEIQDFETAALGKAIATGNKTC